VHISPVSPVVGITWRAGDPPLFAGERNALDAAEVIWKTENDEAKRQNVWKGFWQGFVPGLLIGHCLWDNPPKYIDI